MSQSPAGREHLPYTVTRHLLPDEQVSIVVRQHMIVLVTAAVIGTCALAGAAIADAALWYHHEARPVPVAVLWMIWTALEIWTVDRVMSWRYSYFIVTSGRLILRCGWLSYSLHVLPFNRLRDLELERPWLGRVLGYGNLHTQSMGTGHQLAHIPGIPYPEQINNAIWQIKTAKQNKDQGSLGNDPW
jgi:membrane protein YdbS with pleckstrin-like domain